MVSEGALASIITTEQQVSLDACGYVRSFRKQELDTVARLDYGLSENLFLSRELLLGEFCIHYPISRGDLRIGGWGDRLAGAPFVLTTAREGGHLSSS